MIQEFFEISDDLMALDRKAMENAPVLLPGLRRSRSITSSRCCGRLPVVA